MKRGTLLAMKGYVHMYEGAQGTVQFQKEKRIHRDQHLSAAVIAICRLSSVNGVSSNVLLSNMLISLTARAFRESQCSSPLMSCLW